MLILFLINKSVKYGNMVNVPCQKINLKAKVADLKDIVKPKRDRHPTVHHKDRLYM